MDRFALSAANLLVGNPENSAALECTLAGPSLVALSNCLVAVTGADFGPTLNGEEVPASTGIFMVEGDRLAFSGRLGGARVYIAVAGGLAAERWLGSAATYLLVGRGGVQGGQPSVLRADSQTAGGYPVVAGVARADLPLVAQLLPGDHLRFREISVEAAQSAWRRLRASLDALRS